MLCEVVPPIGGAGAPVVPKLFLVFVISKPPVAHVHRFESSRQDVVSDNAKGGAVVSLNRGGGLVVPKFFEESTTWYGLACVDVQCSEFGFGRRGHDRLDDLGCVEDCSVVRRFVGAIGEEEMPPCATSRFGFAEI